MSQRTLESFLLHSRSRKLEQSACPFTQKEINGLGYFGRRKWLSGGQILYHDSRYIKEETGIVVYLMSDLQKAFVPKALCALGQSGTSTAFFVCNTDPDGSGGAAFSIVQRDDADG